MQDVNVAASRSVVNRPVKNRSDEPLGRIEDLILDLEQGFIAFAVLAVRDLFNRSRKLFVIPWGALRVDPRDESFVLDVAPEVFQQSSGLKTEAMKRFQTQPSRKEEPNRLARSAV